MSGIFSNNSNNKPTTYLFVDGSNFRQYFNETTQKWFGQEVEFDFKKIKDFFNAEKAFYYDCIDDIKSDNESENDFNLRVQNQEEKLNKIREVEGCHVQLGSLSGKGKKKRQKEVDVLLAVQMMEHAFRGNMTRAVLLSGDKDFRPLVESLVRLGLFVEVVGDKNHISKDLIHSADAHKKLFFRYYFEWSSDEAQKQCPINIKTLSFFPNRALQEEFDCMKTGDWNDNPVALYRHQRRRSLSLYSPIISDSDNVAFVLEHPTSIIKSLFPDSEAELFNQLDLYFELTHGKITWK